MNRVAFLLALSLVAPPAALAESVPDAQKTAGEKALASAQPAEPIAAARKVVDETVAEVIAVLESPDISAEERSKKIEEIALERFDWDTISRLVLARNRKQFTPEQQAEFTTEFKQFLAETYGGRIERYDQQSVKVTEERLESRGDVTIRTLIVGGDADGVSIDYRLRGKQGTWRVIDVVIEGVSVVSSFRSQFGELIAEHGPDGLLKRLREKNVAPPPETT